MRIIQKTYTIKAPSEKVWQALVDPSIIEDWGGGPVKMADQEGFEFELWGGDIHGKNIKVIPQKELVQEWTAGVWDQPSVVTFKLIENGSSTRVELLQEEVPDNEADEIEEGWKSLYIGPLKEYVEKFL